MKSVKCKVYNAVVLHCSLFTFHYALKPAIIALALVIWSGCSEKPSANSPASATIVITPNLSVGNVRAGMSTNQVIAELGEPNRRTANALEYTGLGFAVLPNREGMVSMVMCGDVTGVDGPLAKAFKGRTTEGIGIKSTREEVIQAYGQPTETKRVGPGLESLMYEEPGLTFTLEAGKVHHIIAVLRGSTEPDRTVNLEPVPAPPAPKP